MVKSKSLERGFVVASPCGRAWFVAEAKVQADYARFLQEQDGISRTEAMRIAGGDAGFLQEWLGTQYTWSDVEKQGVLLQDATAKDIRNALDHVRDTAEGISGQITKVGTSKS